jgi:penicillin amidase
MQADFNKNPLKKVSWGEARGLKINHLAFLAPFSRLDLKVGGHRSSPNAQLNDFGPSWRMVVELGDEIKAYGVYPGGQSGNPGSPYYDNMLDAWATGQYFSLLFLKNADTANDRIKIKQTFLPKG